MPDEPIPRPDQALLYLMREGWSIGDTAFAGPDGANVYVVYGTNGERAIRAEGASREEAWLGAVHLANAGVEKVVSENGER